jgi:phosphatidylglycerol---prolipoprotein diacylglyceryl transferase
VSFPVYFGIGDWRIHPHLLMEAIAYCAAMQLLLRDVRRKDVIAPTQRSSVIVGGLLGALLGTKGLVMLQHIDLLWKTPDQFWLLIIQGKTIVGVLLGGVLGVELTKKLIGVTQSTGDAFVYPLITGMAIGRVGCFLTGLSDRTYGVATSLPWGVDFGDGISRHPTQLYEILFLLVLLVLLKRRKPDTQESGDRFRLFMIAYLSFRFAIDFIKPDFHPILGMSAIQLACLFGLVYYQRHIRRLVQQRQLF